MAFTPGIPDDTDRLIKNVADGDTAAIETLLERHRARLRRMIALRIDDRLAARVDASDIVQEALVDAARKLADYVRERPCPSTPGCIASPPNGWRRCTAGICDRPTAASRGRTPTPSPVPTARSTAWPKASWPMTPLPARPCSARNDGGDVRATLQELAPIDREILMMHYLEELSLREIAAILDIGEGAAKMRHLRALQRIRSLLAGDGDLVSR